MTYLQQLTVRLAEGIGRLPEQDRARHVRFLLAAQQPDGGFCGRQGDSDLYYTGFALRALAILGELHGEVARRATEFLQSKLAGRESVVDFFSLIYGAALLESAAGLNVFAGAGDNWQDAVSGWLERLRRADGGYAKGELGQASSTYHTFLALLCREMIEREVPQPARIVEFVMSQSADEGGFREIRASKRAGTNPTAAAIATLRILNALDPQIIDDTVDFLADMQTDEGGLRANTRIPIADLLSTFTGLLTLTDLDGLHTINARHALEFVRSLEQPDGGFLGAAWDQACDVEYTFYGLGCRALIAVRG